MRWVPNWYELVLLSLGSYRTTRLAGWDVITRPFREPLTARPEHGDAKEARDTTAAPTRPAWRHHVDVFFHCPFCVGFWVSVAWYAAWLCAGRYALAAAAPLAISASVGLLTKNLDT